MEPVRAAGPVARRGALRQTAITIGILAFTLTGCGGPRGGSGGLPALALRPEPIPYADTLPIHEPAEQSPNEVFALMGEATVGQVGKPFDPDNWIYRNEALNLTHFDDVVNSAWFEHRITADSLSEDDMTIGPTTREGAPRPPYRVIRLKSEGVSPGFWVEDGKGHVYLLKLDPPDYAYLASAASAITNRLFWAAGYYVPEDYAVGFHPTSLVSGREEGDPKAEEIQEMLERSSPLPDGTYRAIASKLLPGFPKGPFRFSGVRKDDPNDYYLHQNRRDLRGLYVISAWTNHVDVRFSNTLDLWIQAPGYLRHYLQDFGSSLGSGTLRPHIPREGLEYNVDMWAILARLPTFGFYHVGWEDQEYEVIDPSIGWLPVEDYRPGGWKPNWPNAAFRSMTVGDGYWAAKIVSQFSDRLIRAAIRAGELPSRHAADTLGSILIARRDMTVHHWFNRVSPIENVTVACGDAAGGFRVTFDDNGIQQGVRYLSNTRYSWELRDETRARAWKGTTLPLRTGRQELSISESGARVLCEPESGGAQPDPELTEDRLAILRIRAEHQQPTAIRRPRHANVYLQWLGEGEGYMVVGLEH